MSPPSGDRPRLSTARRVLALALAGWSVVLPATVIASLAAADTALEPETAAPAAVAAPRLELITERPLFSRTRRPDMPPVAPPPAPPQRPSLDRQIAVKGIYIDGQTARAFVTTPTQADGVWVSPKAEIGGWTVAEIAADRITLKADGETFAALMHPGTAP